MDLQSTGNFTVKNKLVFTINLPFECYDFEWAINQKLIIDGEEWLCVGVERYAHSPPWRKSESIGLMVEKPNNGSGPPPPNKPLVRKVYPFEGNENLLYVCWSVSQQIKRADRDTITHICHSNGQKTLCGISTQNGWLPWDYEVWGPPYDKKGVADIGCIRCKRSMHLTSACRVTL